VAVPAGQSGSPLVASTATMTEPLTSTAMGMAIPKGEGFRGVETESLMVWGSPFQPASEMQPASVRAWAPEARASESGSDR
jgi:hypothetical protein